MNVEFRHPGNGGRIKTKQPNNGRAHDCASAAIHKVRCRWGNKADASTHTQNQGDEKVVKIAHHNPKSQENSTKNVPRLQLLMTHIAV